MISRRTLLILVAFIVVTSTASVAQELPRFKSGDNVVLIGDSITHGGSYHVFLQFFNATQFPNQKVNYFNGGIAGDDCEGTLQRLEKDILIHNPNHAIIMLGMNDVGRWLYPVKRDEVTEDTLVQRKQILERYINNMTQLASRLDERGVKIIFMTPSIYDQTAQIKRPNHFGVNDGLVVFGEEVKKLATTYNAPLVDLNSAMLKINRRLQKIDASATIIGDDRTHPGDEGHLVMGYEIIKSAFPVTYTSKIEIDAKEASVTNKENCEVVLKNGIEEFSVLENALPFAVKESLYPTISLIDNSSEYAQEIITVKKLKKGKYILKIDEEEVGVYSHKQLKCGINLSLNAKTPQYKQSQKVYQLCFDYRKTNNLLRTIAAAEFRTMKHFKGPNTLEAKKEFLFKKVEESIGKSWYSYEKAKAKEYIEVKPKEDSLWADLRLIRDKIYLVNKPVQHVYSLVKQ